MPDLRPFLGIRYASADDMGDLVCPPYDIISAEQESVLLNRHPNNAVRIELAKSASSDDPGRGQSDRYERAAAAFQQWMSEGVLETEASPSLYIYRQDFTTPDGKRGRVTGVIGALRLEEFGDRSGVLPHERTMEGPKKDRMALLEALGANVSPIYGIYRGAGALGPFFDSLENRPPFARFADEERILHRLWIISAPAEIEMLAAAVADGPLVIADGHHRYETALAYHRAHEDEPGEHDSILSLCVDADAEDLVVLPYNRVLRGVGDGLARRLLDISGTPIEERDVPAALASEDAAHRFVFVLPTERFLIEISDEEVVEAVGDAARAWRDLDVVALHEALLPRLIPDGGVEFGFTKDPEEVGRLVAAGWDAGILLRPLSAAQIVDVARSGERMPQKASYFWPKALTGLVFHSLR
ncbi:MAG: DUF1015 family protein [Actinomycetota bacterium]